jgi:hypothetical protein
VRSQVRPYLIYVQTNPAIYMKGTLTLQGYAQMSTRELDIGRVPIPADQINQYDGTFEYFAQSVSNLYQLHISQLYASGGTIIVTGTIPTNVALAPPTEQQGVIRQTSFWAPNPEKAVEAFILVTLVYIVGNILRAQLSTIAEKLRGLVPSGVQMWVENYISSKSEVVLEANKGSPIKLTKVELIAYVITLVTITIAFAYSTSATLAEMLVAIPAILATSARIPIPPLNGKDIWDWNKSLSIVLLLVTFALNLYWLTLI